MSTPPAVSVLLSAPAAADRLRRTMAWLDGQTVGYAEYQVVFIQAGQDHEAEARLAEVSRHRPNVSVVRSVAAIADAAVDWSAGLAAADGDYVLLLGPDDRLQPRALGALLGAARSGGCDVVLGRSSGDVPVGFVPEVLIGGRPAPADLGVALLAPWALIRKDMLAGALDRYKDWRPARIHAGLSAAGVGVSEVAVAVGPGPAGHQPIEDVWREVAAATELLADKAGAEAAARFVAAHLASTARRHPELDPTTEATAVDLVRTHVRPDDLPGLAPYQRSVAAAVLAGDQPDPYGHAVQAIGQWLGLKLEWTTDTLDWTDGRLTITGRATVRARDSGLPDTVDAVSPRLLLRNTKSVETYPVRTEISPAETPSPDERSYRIIGTVDVTDAAAGTPLDAGDWQVLVRLLGAGAEAPKSATVGHAPVVGAVVDEKFVRPYDHDGQLRLEIDGGTHGVFGRYAPDAASITETADGALLRLALDDLATRGTIERPGHLYLGDFPLPATLRVDSDGARLESYLSGLAGVSPLSVRIPPAPKQSLGLQLRIGAVGDMAIEPAPVSTPKSATKAAAKPEAKQAKKATTGSGSAATKKPAAGATKKPAKKTPARQPSSPAVRVIKGVGRRVLPKPARKQVRRMLRSLRQ